jgi:hypothetical protein
MYLAHGTLATHIDRDRLVHLAGECGVADSKRYGMFVQSVTSLTITQSNQTER